VRHKIPSSIQKAVRQRANFLCEYCHALEFNRGRVITIRKADLEIGRHPPENDPML